jgi:hypothetical protein
MSDEEKRTYPSMTLSTSLKAGLGVPPLKMVLVHLHNDHAPEAVKAVPTIIQPEEEIAENDVAVRVIVRLIEYFKKD